MQSIEVPVCLSGFVTPVHPSLCMDGATHLLNTPIVGSIRIKATNDEAQKALERHSEKDVVVTVCGYPRNTANCQHIEAYYVASAEEAAPKLKAL